MNVTDLPLAELPESLRRRVSQVLSQRKNASALCYRWSLDLRSGYVVRLTGLDFRYSVLSEDGLDKVSLVPETAGPRKAVLLYLGGHPGIL